MFGEMNKSPNFADNSSRQALIDILHDLRLPFWRNEIILNSVYDDLGVGEQFRDFEAIEELAGWLELLYDFDELNDKERETLCLNLQHLGCKVEDWTVRIVDNGYIRVELTELVTRNGFQFDVAFKSDGVSHNKGKLITYPSHISGIIASPSMWDYIQNFANEFKHYTNY